MVDSFYVHILAHMGSQLIVLRFFESLGILSGSKFFTLHFSFFPQNVLDDGSIIQEAVGQSAEWLRWYRSHPDESRSPDKSDPQTGK